MKSGFRRVVNENCALPGYKVASGGNSLLTFRDNLPVHFSRVKILDLNLEDGTDRLSRNVGKDLPLFAT